MRRVLTCFLLATFALGGSASTAFAWTEAGVNSVKVHVSIDDQARAQVYYELVVGVHGGWVEGLEITGLDAGFELIPDIPVSWVSEDGERKYTPTTRLRRDSTLLLGFRRSTSPRRGHYRVRFAYTVDLATEGIRTSPQGELLFQWTLPAWSSGLDDVGISVSTPPGSAEADTGAGTTGARADVWSNGQRTLLLWHRAHLPRTMPWTVEINLARQAMAPDLFRPTRAKREARAASEPAPTRRSPLPWIVGLFVGVLALLRTLLFHRAAGKRGSKTVPLIPSLPLWLRVSGILGLGGLSLISLHQDAIMGALVTLTATVLLAMDRVPLSPGTPRLGGWHQVTPQDLRRALTASVRERILGTNPMDLSALSGWVIMTAGAAGLYALTQGSLEADSAHPNLHWQLFLLLVPLGLTGTRLHLPLSPALSLRRLASIARHMRVDLAASVRPTFKLVAHETDSGRWQDVRLRVLCDDAPRGLLRCDIALGQRRDLGGFSAEPTLLLVTRDASRAEAALLRVRPDLPCEVAAGGRIARALSLRDGAIGPVLELLSEIRTRTSRGTLPPPRPPISPSLPPPLPYTLETR
jgi:hypothetical protein